MPVGAGVNRFTRKFIFISPAEAVAQQNRRGIQAEQQHQQDEDGCRRQVAEFSLRAGGPLVDLDGQGGELGERADAGRR